MAITWWPAIDPHYTANAEYEFVAFVAIAGGTISSISYHDSLSKAISAGDIKETKTAVTLTLEGVCPLDWFPGFSVTYVDRGKSDKSQTPITVKLPDMPDNKELYKMETFDTPKIWEFDITAIPYDGAVSTMTYTLEVHPQDATRDWIKDYMKHRYNKGG